MIIFIQALLIAIVLFAIVRTAFKALRGDYDRGSDSVVDFLNAFQ